jgi:SPP1 gp7 family putative phage head morphogenesis protein
MKPKPFKEAVEFYRSKTALPEAQFNALAAEIGDYAHSLAFTVKGITQADVLMDLHAEVIKSIESGQTFGEFREAIDEIMTKRGWSGLSPYRLDNIFRTNLQSAYSVGRYKQMTAIAERRPYWQYDAVNDSRTRPSHLAQDGKVYRHDHPFWSIWYPPNGYRCRCRVVSLSREEMQEDALAEETQGTDLRPDEGFAFNPATESWRPDMKKYPAALRRIIEEDLK